MIDLFEPLRVELPDLIRDAAGWDSLDITYRPPRVQRLWRTWRGYRVNLHCIEACDDPFYHPHPWPCAIWTVRGRQEVGFGFGKGTEPPPVASRVVLGAGSFYEMTEFDAWHYVKVTSGPMLSVMITGAPWGRKMPDEPKIKLSSLHPDHKADLLRAFYDLVCWDQSWA